MSIRSSALLASSVVASLLVVALSHAAERPGPQDQSLLDLDLEALMKEEVVVTANKRHESLQKVPISMSVFSADTLEKRGLDSFQDLAAAIPSMSFRSTGPGRQMLTLRGLSSSAGSSPTVSFYVDETPIPALSTTATTAFQQVIPDLYLFDLERVEVLRGPQGTLYGSSSMGGTVRFLTKQPVLDTTEGSTSASISNTEHGRMNWSTTGMLNVPLVEHTALRVAGTYSDDGGYIDRLVGDFSGPNRSPVGPVQTQRDIDALQTASLRISLQIQPADDYYLRPMIYLSRLRQDGLSYFDRPPGELQQRVPLVVPEPYADDFRLYGLNAGLQLPRLSLTSASTYTQREMSTARNEAESFLYSFGDGPLLDPVTGRRTRDPGSPQWQTSAYPVMDHDSQSIRDFTQEVRVTSTTDSALQYLLGVYYKDTHSRGRVHEELDGYTAAFPLYTAIIGPDFGDNFYTFETDASYREYALFGELNYNFTPRLKATVGARWYDYRLQLDTVANGFFNNTPVPVRAELPPMKQAGVNPRLILSYDLSHDASVYVSASKGARPGGLNSHAGDTQCANDLGPLRLDAIPASYDGDSLWNYEVGSKNQFLSQRLTLNAAAYVVDWSGVQQRINLLSCGFTFIANAGKARSQGVELETDLLLTDHLRFGLGAGYTDAQITEVPAGAPVLRGQRLLDAPKWTGGAWTEYSFPLHGGLDGYLRADWSYTGESVENFDNGHVPNTAADPYGSMREAYDVANLKFAVVATRWSAALYIHNALDTRAEYTRSDTLGILYDAVRQVVTNQPRTIGITSTVRF
jgi:iron complex outermembrane recepter protein